MPGTVCTCSKLYVVFQVVHITLCFILHCVCSSFACYANDTVSSFTAETDMQRLSHALKILSETEKQLRMSKNQSTWLTVALLQLSSLETPSLNANDPKSSLRNAHDRGQDTD